MSTPVILFALTEEAAPFLARLSRVSGIDVRRSATPALQRRHAEAYALDVVLAGPGEAAMRDALAEIDGPVLHAGFAGALRADLEMGAVRQIASVRHGPEVLAIPAHPGWQAGGVPPASIVSVPAPANAAAKALMAAHRAADLVDMETWAVASGCLARGVPYIGLRVVSDALGDDIPEYVTASWDGRRFSRARILAALFQDPRRLGGLLRLRRQSRDAAGALAATLLEILDSGSLRP